MLYTFASTLWMRARPIRFTRFLPRIHYPGNRTDDLRPIHILHKPVGNRFSFPAVSNTLRDELFRETGQGRRSSDLLHREPHSSRVPPGTPQNPFDAAGYCPRSFAGISQREALLTKFCLRAGDSRKLSSSRIGRIEPAEVRTATIDDWHRGTAKDSLRGT
jgi:hypothetical protein